MLVLDPPQGAVEADMPLTLDEYLSLPEDARAELVDGVLRPMVRASHLHREVQLNLAYAFKAQRPPGLRVAAEEVVVLSTDPPHARIPDVAIFSDGSDPTGRQNSTPADSVVLVVEIVSESTQTADRYEKPAEYARSGLPVFWRIELEPSIVIWTYRLVDGVYQDSGQFGAGDVVRDGQLPWLEIDVTRLLGDFAPLA